MDWKSLFPRTNIYFETKNGILYCGDSLEIMRSFPRNKVDLVITDPPYNIASSTKLTKSKGKIKSNKEAWGNEFKDEWDSLEEYSSWLLCFAREIRRLLSDRGNFILFLDRTYSGFFIYKIEVEFGFKFRNKLYFEKTNPLPHFRKNNYRSCVEEAVWFTKSDNYYINFISQKDMRQIFKGSIGKKRSKHPTEKYEWMIEPLVVRHSLEGDLVLDPFLGSGTVAVICEKLNRRWIGIEINEKYCEVTKKRILEI